MISTEYTYTADRGKEFSIVYDFYSGTKVTYSFIFYYMKLFTVAELFIIKKPKLQLTTNNVKLLHQNHNVLISATAILCVFQDMTPLFFSSKS
jgi:hypothetical protein